VGTSPEIGPATVSRPYTRIYCIVYTIYIVPISLHRDAVAHSPGGAKVNPVCVDRVRGRLVWTSVYIIEDRVRCGDVPGNRPGDCFDAIYSYILYYIVSPQVGIYIYINSSDPVCVDRVRGRLVWTSVYFIEDRVRCGDVPGNRPGDRFDAIYSYILYI